jgi:uncharacterized iron-regulated protein
MKTVFLIFSIGFFGIVASQNKQSYQIFNQSGKKVSYKKLINSSQKSDVLLFGEYHDNSVAHWLELEITKDLLDKKNLVLGAEMFEADNQKQVNQYLKGEINQKKLDSTARLWPNYKTDYKPLVDFAKDLNIAFVATNIPRRFASLVFKKGFEALEKLSDEEKSWIAPLPILYDPTLPGYLKIVQEMGGHGGENLPKAQAVKDATMASFIVKNQIENTLFIHYNGSYHSDNFEGIYWYLKQQNSNLKIITIATVSQKDISKLDVENYNKATFIIVIDEDVTKTY